MNKPLTKKKLLEVNRALNGELSLGHKSELFTEVAGAEAYWREAVRIIQPEDDYGKCQWCDTSGFSTPAHTEDCPWLLAQEPR